MRRALWVMVIVSGVWPGVAAGWAWRVHRMIAYRAAQAMRDELPLGGRSWRQLCNGAVAPDAKGHGHLPPQDHVFHITRDRKGNPFGNAPRRIQEMAWRLASEDLPDDQVLFELGRVSHLVADLAQPLHADGKRRCPTEEEFHHVFESAVDADPEVERLQVAVPPAGALPAPWLPQDARANDWETRMEALARESWRDYDAVCAAYVAKPGVAPAGYAGARAIAHRRVERAVVMTVEIWRAVLERRGRAGRLRRESGVWSCVAVPLVLLWFVFRGRVKQEESVWPGEPPPGPGDRKRSDLAFRKLEERLGLRREAS